MAAVLNTGQKVNKNTQSHAGTFFKVVEHELLQLRRPCSYPESDYSV